MKQSLLIFLVSLLAVVGITAGIVKAQSSGDVRVDTSSTTVSTAETTTPSTTTTTTMMGKHHGRHLQDIADLLGLSLTDLQAKLDSGTPLYKVMVEKGWTYTKLMEKKQADFEAQLKDMISVGYLTQEQADQFLAKMKERLASGEMMPMGMMSGHHGFGH
ncbi:MAG: hypothetical protein HY420_01995 [Candidatus Kerfeldbacteria bacterium]|nr:hypothetical protein [Candidatus Kerfeldbacteria bacterium]